MDCPTCGARDMIEISNRLADDIELHFFSCHRCEEKWWDKDGETVSLGEVLDLARKTQR